MNYPLINRQALKIAMKGKDANYQQMADYLNISKTAFAFKIRGRKNRGQTCFTEEEVQILRSMFGDSILYPAQNHGQPKGRK